MGGGSPSPVPHISGRAAGLGAVFAGKRPRAELTTPRIGCSVTTRKPGPGRSEPAADGVPQPACLHPWRGRTPIPRSRLPPEPRGRLLPTAAVPSQGLLFCVGEQGGRSGASCLQPPLGREFILC